MLEFTELVQFRLVSKSCNWIATRRQLLRKFRKVKDYLEWEEFDHEHKSLKKTHTEMKFQIFDLAKDENDNETSRAPQQATIIDLEGVFAQGLAQE